MANEKRLIDANELEAKFHETKMIEIFPYWKELNFDTQCELVRFGKALKKMMQNAPTVDAVEVVHGRWIIDENTLFEQEGCCRLVCSVCGRIVHNVENPKKAMEYRPYCHCGAKMDGDSK